MSFKFENLIIWQQNAMNLGERIYEITDDFLRSETYNLTSQIRRAGDSIALNIAEGSILQSNKENCKFLGYSIRSISSYMPSQSEMKKAHYRRCLSKQL